MQNKSEFSPIRLVPQVAWTDAKLMHLFMLLKTQYHKTITNG